MIAAMEAEPESVAWTSDWKALYHEAFRRYGAMCLWNVREFDDPSPGIALATARQLRYEGDMAARILAERIERLVRAA
jgi:hypothetical protein